ncbi:MAG: Blue-light-activated protein [Syntrophorhabdus sp. PtaB.Bin006]|nr:MAG: Blue-light-activated protein [Syntrophorhabdus sp. PtaB.Bin006]
MKDHDKTKEQLINELAEMGREIEDLKKSEAGHREAEKALREREEQFRNLMEYMPVSVQGYRTDGTVVYWNKASESIYGYSSDEALGRNLEDLIIPAELKPLFRECLVLGKQVRKSGEFMPSGELLLLHKDGHLVPVYSIHTASVPEGKETLLFCMDVDLSAHKRAEEALMASERNLRTILDSVNDAIFIHTVSGEIIDVNKKMLELYKVSREEALQMTIANNFSAPDNPLDTLPETWESIIRGEKRVFEWKAQSPRDGSVWNVEVFLRKITLNDRDAILATIHDITGRKRMEEKRLELERRLLQTQKLEGIGVLAGGIAHDFNNLLMGIQGYASLMLHGIDITHQHYQKLKNIEELIKSGSNLTGQLLGFARGGKYEVKPTDLNALITRSADMFAQTRRELTVHRKLADNLAFVDADQGQIEQVLLNLYLNAWQAMPGGGDLTVETENVLLDETCASQFSLATGRYVKVSIIDTGVGMDERTQKRIFEPFFTTREMGRGSGLGLASAYGIIKHHGGVIEVSSEKGRGSTFTIYLGVSKKKPVTEKRISTLPQKGSETILLVDDQDMILDTCGEALRTLGYTVIPAKSGQEALEIYAHNKEAVDLVVLDMIMPGLSGGATYDKLKETDQQVKVLLSSGYSIDGQASQILERGCNGFIQKPFDIQTLSQKIREVLE